MKKAARILLPVLLSTACGPATFKSIQPRSEPEAPATIESQDADVTTGGTRSDTVDIPINTRSPGNTEKKPSDEESDNQKLLSQCLNQWQGQDLALELLKKPHVIEANQFQSGDLVFEDRTPTSEPILYLIHVNFNIETSGRMELRNPNGWYCVNIRSQVVKTFDINVSCRTVVATVTRPGQTYDRFDIQREAPCS